MTPEAKLNELLDAYKLAHNIPSDFQLAHRLKMSHVHLRRWREGNIGRGAMAVLNLLLSAEQLQTDLLIPVSAS